MRHRLLTLVLIFSLLPTTACGFPRKVERWRPQVRASLKAHHIYSKWLENKEISIIYRESRGYAKRGNRHGCFGLLQFGTGWSLRSGGYGKHKGLHKDWRWCGTCSIHRFSHVLRDGGRAAIRRHWRATYGR